MIKIIVLCLVTTTASADICASMGDLGEQIMTARQVGVPLSTMMQIISEEPDTKARKLASSLTVDAYASPTYSSTQYKALAITNFRTEVEVACYDAVR